MIHVHCLVTKLVQCALYIYIYNNCVISDLFHGDSYEVKISKNDKVYGNKEIQ